MNFYIRNLTCNGTRFFIIENLENPRTGFSSVGSYELSRVNNAVLKDNNAIVKSLQEYGLESKFMGSIIKSETRFLLLGWN
jgi:hypothetical protein